MTMAAQFPGMMQQDQMKNYGQQAQQNLMMQNMMMQGQMGMQQGMMGGMMQQPMMNQYQQMPMDNSWQQHGSSMQSYGGGQQDAAPAAPAQQEQPQQKEKRDRSSSRRRRSPSRSRRRRNRSDSRRRDRSRSRRRRSPSRRRRRDDSRRRSRSRGGDRDRGGRGGDRYGGGSSYGGGGGGGRGGVEHIPGLTLPSMTDVTSNPNAHCSNNTVQDQEVKVIDPRGNLLPNPQRYATFEETTFTDCLKQSLRNAGFPSPSQIQQYTWPLSMQGRDTIGVAATGSGKTISFLLPAFDYIIRNRVPAGGPTLLVMAPTRELAVQIQDEAVKFGKQSNIASTCVYGGAPKQPQAADLRAGVHAVIGTPGRLNDFLEAGQLRLQDVKKLVLDEADRMLDMGFEPQIRKVLAPMPRNRHSLFFTATWPQSIRRLASEFLNNPLQVQIGNRDELKGNQDITQIVKCCSPHQKPQYLMQILQQAGVNDRNNTAAKGLVFCSTKRMCDEQARNLNSRGIPCAAIHGDKGQREREQALGDLKEGRIKLLVATDVAARGIDIKGVTLVVNYDPPGGTEDYVHRIGRTGRAGQKGFAVTLICDRDAYALKGIIEVMKRTNQEITEEMEKVAANAGPPPPTGRALRKGGGKGKK